MDNYLLEGEMYQYSLGWLIKRVKSLETDLNTAIDLKTIHYADPIQWDITTQYPPNTVVVDPKTGTAYMSKVPVPAGILLTNTTYWVVVFNYQQIYEDIKDGIASNERSNEYASHDYAVNDLVWWSNNLYLVLKPITSGGQFKPNDNITRTTIEDLLTQIRDSLTHLQADNYIADVKGDYTVNAGDIAMTSANATMHTTKDRTVDTDGNDSVHIDGASTLNVGGLRTETFAGDKTETVTGTQTEKAGNRNTTVTGKWMVNTPSKSFDMAEVATIADTYAAIDSRRNLHLLTIGDSYDTITGTDTSWSNTLAKRLGAKTHYKYGASGMGFINGTWLTELNRAISTLTDGERDACNMIVVGGGANDLTTTADAGPFYNAIQTFVNRAHVGFKNAVIYIAFMADGMNGYITSVDSWSTKMTPWSIFLTENFYRFATVNAGAIYLNATRWSKKDYFNSNDYIHPNSEGQQSIGDTVFSAMYNIPHTLNTDFLVDINGTETKIGYIDHHEFGRNVHLDYIQLPCNIADFTGFLTQNYAIGKIKLPISQCYNITVSGGAVIDVTTAGNKKAYLVPVNFFTTDDGLLYLNAGVVENGAYVNGVLNDITMKLVGNAF